MNEIQREVLLENRLYLAETFLPKIDECTLEKFLDKAILNRGDVEVGQRMEENGRFCLVVDDRLPTRGPAAFDKFCVILACNENARAAAKLKIGEVRRQIEVNAGAAKPADVCEHLLKVRYIEMCKTELKARPEQTPDKTTRQMAMILSDVKRESVPIAPPEKNPVLKYVEAEMTNMLTVY